MLQTIPAFNRDKATLKSTDRPAALAPTVDYKEKYEKLLLRADKLASDKSRLESEVAVLREQTKRARKKAKRNDSGDGSLGASGSPSPTKPAVPGGGSAKSAPSPLAPSLTSGGPFLRRNASRLASPGRRRLRRQPCSRRQNLPRARFRSGLGFGLDHLCPPLEFFPFEYSHCRL
jgi:hypothetical protein